ncbi:MAG: amidohydrolase family protein [Acidobacteria bacterium]|nr:amidohydrolase family protein [Acidobacteriota bacterium]
MIWDLHCHFSGFGGRTPEEGMAEVIRLGDRMGIERFCIYLGFGREENPSPAQMRTHNDEVLRALDHWRHRAWAFVYLNPNYLDESLREFDRCVKDGPMVGVKLWVAQKASGRALDPIIERAAAMQAVIFQHTWWKTGGNLSGESTPLDVVELAKRHPKTPIICGHTGGNWELGIRAVRGQTNLSVDLAGSDPTNGFVEMAVRELGAERIIWGSDAGGRSLGSQLAKVQGSTVPEAAKKLMLGENLKRMMMPILTAKGFRV